MKHSSQPQVAQAESGQTVSDTPSPAPESDIRLLLLTVLKMLEPYVREASIELKNGERVSINEAWKVSTQFHCGEEKRPCAGEKGPCAEVEMVEGPGGDIFALCKKLAQAPDFAAQLERVKSNHQGSPRGRLKLLLVSPADAGEAYSAFGESATARRGILDHILKVVQGMCAEEKSNLLSVCGESEFSAFIEKDDDLEKLQSIKYGFSRRINKLRPQIRDKKIKRPVKEQRRVGGCLYILQPGQKGGDYWYMQYTENGKRKQVYLGKEKPSFVPAEDLARKNAAKSTPARK